ncbi:MAG: hypothetical protein JWM32_2171 [Verrucomicrobia bacterium]|nr:hypothetical protein [Verrucomicrobiota bacterium]
MFAFPLLDLEAMGKEYFVSTLHGLKIERIVVDGVTLPPPEKRIYVDEGLREVIRCGGTVQIYQVVHGDQLVFAEHLGPDADTTVYRGYEIIENYRSLSITYRIRYPDMSLGPLSTLRVLRGKPPLPARK